MIDNLLIAAGIYAFIALAVFAWQVRAGEVLGDAALQGGGWIVFAWAEISSRYQQWKAERE